MSTCSYRMVLRPYASGSYLTTAAYTQFYLFSTYTTYSSYSHQASTYADIVLCACKRGMFPKCNDNTNILYRYRCMWRDAASILFRTQVYLALTLPLRLCIIRSQWQRMRIMCAWYAHAYIWCSDAVTVDTLRGERANNHGHGMPIVFTSILFPLVPNKMNPANSACMEPYL